MTHEKVLSKGEVESIRRYSGALSHEQHIEQLYQLTDCIEALRDQQATLLAALKAEELSWQLIQAESPRERLKLFESNGDHESGWMDTTTAFTHYAVRAREMRQAAIADAEGSA